MSAVRATWHHGQVVLEGKADWPEGRRLVVAEEPADIDFMTEDEQADDPKAIETWVREVEGLPALAMTAEQEADMLAWRKKAKEFNLEAMRQQMAEGIP